MTLAWRMIAGVVLAVAAVVALLAAPASAHEPGSTGLELELGNGVIDGVFELPLLSLQAALGVTIAIDPVGLSSSREVVTAYVADHLEVTTGDDTWLERFGRLTSVTISGFETLRLEVTLEAAGSVATTEFVLSYDGLVEHDASHLVFITVIDRNGDHSLQGVLDDEQASLAVGATSDRGASRSMRIMLNEGFDHVLDGADHMLFLLVLLVPAPLVPCGGRWQKADGGWRAVRRVAHVATAFTVGHSVTLAASALGWLALPTSTIEVLIGVSVAVSALHAMRPLVARGEVLIAAGFGLVHGLAFAGILDELALGTSSLPSLLGFNLGIEVAQLAIIGLTFPSIYVLSRGRAFPPVRIVAAASAFAAATGWVIARLGVAASPFGTIESIAVDHLGWLVAALAAGALASAALSRWSATRSAAVAELALQLDREQGLLVSADA